MLRAFVAVSVLCLAGQIACAQVDAVNEASNGKPVSTSITQLRDGSLSIRSSAARK